VKPGKRAEELWRNRRASEGDKAEATGKKTIVTREESRRNDALFASSSETEGWIMRGSPFFQLAGASNGKEGERSAIGSGGDKRREEELTGDLVLLCHL